MVHSEQDYQEIQSLPENLQHQIEVLNNIEPLKQNLFQASTKDDITTDNDITIDECLGLIYAIF